MRGLAEEAGLMMEEFDWHHPSGQQWVVYRPSPNLPPHGG